MKYIHATCTDPSNCDLCNTMMALRQEGMQHAGIALGVDDPPAREFTPPYPALAHQEGGAHYKDLPIQPVQYIHANGIGYFEGNVIKYVTRWRTKGGVEDLKKARHYLDLLIDLEGKR